MTNTSTDMNRDPLSGTPGAHPVGVGVGGAGGAVAGAAIGSLLGPIGTLIGGAIGTVAGAAAGKGVAERIDPTGEADYWRTEYAARPYYNSAYTYDDYGPAYSYGNDVRAQYAGRTWDSSLESDVRQGWEAAKANSRLKWEEAKDAVRDAFDRSDRTYRAYDATDRHYADKYQATDYYKDDYSYDQDYRPAYRYGTYSRSQYAGRQWDDALERDLERGWDRAKGTSKMAWNDAKGAVRDAWHGVERVLPGDADRDGR
ncbi:MAG: hypothetical protein EOP93_06395 [Lysobacteraceae bacterium]|nr:MAG: hypothetical protein EOP93_06395 [Xanthomonadaceae bacterium]